MNNISVEKEILIRGKIETIFKALTNSEEIPKYFPIEKVESNWNIGSELILKGNIGGNGFTDYGIIEKLEPPRSFQYRYWSTNHGTERLPENYVIISYELSEIGNNVKLNMIQSNLVSIEMQKIMYSVWSQLLNGFKEYIENRI